MSPPPIGNPNAPSGKLRMTRREADRRLSRQIRMGDDLVNTYFRSPGHLDSGIERYEAWDKFNQALLRDMFEEGITFVRQYLSNRERLVLFEYDSLEKQAVEFKLNVGGIIEIIEDIKDNLYLYDEPDGFTSGRKKRAALTPEVTNEPLAQAQSGPKTFISYKWEDPEHDQCRAGEDQGPDRHPSSAGYGGRGDARCASKILRSYGGDQDSAELAHFSELDTRHRDF